MHLNGYTATEVIERDNLRQVEYLNRELSKYRDRLESMRPKQKNTSSNESTPQSNNSRMCPMENVCGEVVESFAQIRNVIPSEFMARRESCSECEFDEIEGDCDPLDATRNASMAMTTPSTENAEMNDRPTLKFSIQESLSVSRHDNDGEGTVTEIMNKQILTPNHAFDGALSLDHHMSIFIRRLDLCESNEAPQNDGETQNNGISEKTSIINALFDRKQRENRSLLQKYFMRWVHFNTIEKLTKRNPDQTRLRKMEIFLQNITLERKKTLQKLKAINRVESTHYTPAKPKFTTDSPELLARKFNNK